MRKIQRVIDFEFIRDQVKDLYCADNKRPAVVPVVLFKMLFLGDLFGVRSERQLVREIQVSVAYRWFLGFGLTDKIPDASTFSQNQRRRFTQSTVYQEIFDEIVLQGMRRKLIGGRGLYSDSTHLKAIANKNKFTNEQIELSFADGKELHGHRYVRMRGLWRAQEQCLLSAACQNMKKMALILSRGTERATKQGLRTVFAVFKERFRPFFVPFALLHA